MTREETIYELGEWLEQMIQHGVPSHSAKRKALATAIALLSAESEQTVYCMDCAKSAPLDEHGASAFEIVQCKNCKHCSEYYDRDGYPYWTCDEWDCGTDADGFCHYGERKGGEDE